MRIVLMGSPGSGKGTQAQRIFQDYNLTWLSTGSILRKAVAAGTALGKQIENILSSGGLVPDMIVTQLVENNIKNNSDFLLDGYPRSLNQAITLDKILKLYDLKLDCVIRIDVSDSEVRQRITGRVICSDCGFIYHCSNYNESAVCSVCGKELELRNDDSNESTVSERIRVYHNNSKDISDYYDDQGILYIVDGSGKIEDVFARIKIILDNVEDN